MTKHQAGKGTAADTRGLYRSTTSSTLIKQRLDGTADEGDAEA